MLLDSEFRRRTHAREEREKEVERRELALRQNLWASRLERIWEMQRELRELKRLSNLEVGAVEEE